MLLVNGLQEGVCLPCPLNEPLISYDHRGISHADGFISLLYLLRDTLRTHLCCERLFFDLLASSGHQYLEGRLHGGLLKDP